MVSSALSQLVTNIGASIKLIGRYNSLNTFSARVSSMPKTTRSGRIKSPMAAPSRKNSGLDATEKSASGLTSAINRDTWLAVPTGTVDLLTITV